MDLSLKIKINHSEDWVRREMVCIGKIISSFY